MKFNINFNNDKEKEYSDIFFDFFSNNMTGTNHLNILKKIKQQFNITEERACEIEEAIKNQLNNVDNTHFYSDNEKDYYNFLINFIIENNGN